MRRTWILGALVSLVLATGAVWPTHREDISGLARRFDTEMGRFEDRVLDRLHHQDNPGLAAQETRLVMATSALRGQARTFRALEERRGRVRLRVAFTEIEREAGYVDQQVRQAHTTGDVRRHWQQISDLLDRMDAELGGRPRGPGYYGPQRRSPREEQEGRY